MTIKNDYEQLQRELMAAHEMLAVVLHTVGKVTVTKETLTKGLPEGSQIIVNDNLEKEAFEFSLEVPDGQ